MDPIVGDWLSLVVRWVHIIAGIAWIGASFYFNWLLIRLLRPEEEDGGVVGELWAIHAGGFFRVQKRKIPSGRVPVPLHWFKWEAYWTWISGFMLLVIIYYMGAKVYLIDPRVADIGAGAAVAIGTGTLIASWLVYDYLWRSPVAADQLLTTGISLVLLVFVAFGLSQVFSGRGAYIHVGAVLGTLMAGNVFRVIMPAQRELVSAAERGDEPDPSLAGEAELRSLHNNYLTLPVLFVMISNHYPSTFGHELNWIVLAVLFLVGGLVRHYFNVRDKQGNWASAWLLGLAAVIVVGLAVLTAPPRAHTGLQPVSFAQVKEIISERCLSCHSRNPSSELFTAPPTDLTFDTPGEISARADIIMTQTVATQAMPLGNLTQMTQDERDLLGQWISEGASIE